MKVNEIIGLIPEKLFDDLSAETKVDTQVKYLTGETIFKLILFSMLGSNKLSLRVMEGFLKSAQFKYFNQRKQRARRLGHRKHPYQCKFNSIRDRICTMDALYFEMIFEEIFKTYNKELKEERSLAKVDSTYISLAAKLFGSGMKNGNDKSKRLLKYSIVLKGSLPCKAKVFTDQSYVSEDLALTDVINETDVLIYDVVVFDRGLLSRNSFDKFTESSKFFITRGNMNIRCNVLSSRALPKKAEKSSITITSDEIGTLINKTEQKTTYLYRVIKGVIDESVEAICFISNLLEEDAYIITKMYRERWEIELFFKFIKQHLNTSHLVSRDENGIKVMLYMTMILAILLIVYKKTNKIKGVKMAKMAFEIELNNEITKAIVILCGGDPNKEAHLWN